VALALFGGVLGTSLGLFRAKQARAKAEAAAKQATENFHRAEASAGTLLTNLYFNHVALAHRELSAAPSNVKLAEQLLEACPDQLRHWEWRYLKRRRYSEPLVLTDPGSKEMFCVAFSPDGQHLAAGSGDGKVRIWDARHLEAGPTRLSGHTGYVFSVAFSPTNPALIASLASDHRLVLWDWPTGREIHTWPCEVGRDTGMNSAVAFSPDGRLLAAVGPGGDMIIRETARQRGSAPARTRRTRDVRGVQPPWPLYGDRQRPWRRPTMESGQWRPRSHDRNVWTAYLWSGFQPG
jgi:hypothetical protein